MTLPKSRLRDPGARSEVWKNLIIIRARNAREALSKAIKIGTAQEGDCGGTLRLYGKPAVTEFLGIASVGVIHDDLADGSEITWELTRCRQKTARSLVQRPEDLIASLEKEFRKAKIPRKGSALDREVKEFIQADIKRRRKGLNK